MLSRPHICVNAGYSYLDTRPTDYRGRGQKPIGFRTHGKLDRLQAGFAAIAPKLLGFSDESTAYFFRGQAVNETLVLAMTDFEAAERGSTRFRRRKKAA